MQILWQVLELGGAYFYVFISKIIKMDIRTIPLEAQVTLNVKKSV